MSVTAQTQYILLLDDDTDDVDLFRDVLDEIPLSTRLEVVNNGVHLLQKLADKHAPLPDVIFLDLNMPRENGFECLSEIRKNEKLRDLPVVIYSTTGRERGCKNTLSKWRQILHSETE